MKRVFLGISGILSVFLFVQCETPVTQPSKPVVLASIKLLPQFGQQELYEAKYNNGKLTQLGTSTYFYNDAGQVNRSVETILVSDIMGDGAEISQEIEYSYSWDDMGRIMKIELLSPLEISSLKTYKGYQPNRQFFYSGSSKRPTRVELTYDPLLYNMERAVQTYYYSVDKLDSVSITNYYTGRPLDDRWRPADPNVYPNPIPGITELKHSYIVQSSDHKNRLAPLFASLGFIPYQLHFFPFEVFHLTNDADRFSFHQRHNSGGIVDSLFLNDGIDVTYKTDATGRLNHLDYISKYPKNTSYQFLYKD